MLLGLGLLAGLLNGAEKQFTDPVFAAKTGPVTWWARLKFPVASRDANWAIHPHGDLALIDFIRRHTTLNLSPEWQTADIDKLDDMVRFPFIFMTSDWPAKLSEAQLANLREYLLRGGFLLADDCIAPRNDAADYFFRSMAEALKKAVPEARLGRLPNEHPVFHLCFEFDQGLPHFNGTPHGLWALVLEGRVLALLSPSDLHCGWTNGDVWYYRGATEKALKMGTNIYLFAMTQTAPLPRK